ncbi:MAG: hypothetical protein H6711_23070 [Myxococcales bacterium]|nr:hypothetical protein [Myxococcales bacterium]
MAPRTTRAALPLGLGLGLAALFALSLAPGLARADAPASGDEGLHRGRGWYSADVRVPEPPLALALVIIGAAAMRRRDRRLLHAR